MSNKPTTLVKALLCASLMTAMVGCSTMTPIEKGGAAGAVIGGGLGLGAGSIWSGINLGEGLLLGSSIGAVSGGLIGADICCRNCMEEMASLRDLENQMDQMKLNQEDIDALKRRIKELEDKMNQGQKELDELRKLINEKGMNDVVDANMTPKGLALTILGDTLYTPGKAQLSDTGKQKLDEVVALIKDKYAGREISVEGHTDSDPIKASNWKSNWELGAARSLSVLHYLVDTHQLSAAKVSATTFGEFRPRESNANADGKKLNRRAVIVIANMPMDALGSLNAQ